MPTNPRFSHKQALAMKRLLDQGVLRSEIGRRFNCSHCAVSSTLARLEGPPALAPSGREHRTYPHCKKCGEMYVGAECEKCRVVDPEAHERAMAMVKQLAAGKGLQ